MELRQKIHKHETEFDELKRDDKRNKSMEKKDEMALYQIFSIEFYVLVFVIIGQVDFFHAKHRHLYDLFSFHFMRCRFEQ